MSTNIAHDFIFPNDVTINGDLDIQGIILSLKLPLVAGDIGSPALGEVWFDTVSNQAKLYNGTNIVIMG